MNELKVDLGDRSYKIFIGEDAVSKFEGTGIIITDENVNELYPNVLPKLDRIVVKPGEGSKSIENLAFVYDELLKRNITRKDSIIALGGGVVGDLAGFAAATILRGVDYYQIPTTLLAQVDSSVGGKTGINLLRGKNLVGSFHQPKAVFIDPNFLLTLPKREFSSGMAEVIKYACIKNEKMFESLEGEDFDMEDIIYQSCKIKAQIVSDDEHEQGDRKLLNFGHTIGHGVEKAVGFGSISHGAAVAVGMCAITRYSETKGITKIGTASRIEKLCEKFSLPTSSIEYDLESMAHDKKTEGDQTSIVLLNKIGSSFYEKVLTSEFLEEVPNWI